MGNGDNFFGIVYIRVFPNGKVYIGQTTRGVKKRWKEQNRAARNNKNGSPKLFNALRKYNYKTKDYIIAYAINQEQLDMTEKFYIQWYDSIENGYNILLDNSLSGNKAPMFGKKHSQETKKRISQKNSGINNGMYGVKGELHPNYGRKVNVNVRKKISKKLLKLNSFNFHGVSFRKDCSNIEKRCWRSKIRYNNKDYDLGNFNDPLSGQIVYDLVWREIYGL